VLGRRGIPAAVVSLALCAVIVAFPAAASAEPGAQLGFIRTGSHLFNVETAGADGSAPKAIFKYGRGGIIPFPNSPPAWTSDGNSLLFVGTGPAGETDGPGGEPFDLYSVPVEGGAPVPVPGASQVIFPLALPDGTSVAVVKVRGQNSEESSGGAGGHEHVVKRTQARSSLWIVSLDGGPARQVTPWRANVIVFPVSSSPDGRTLTVTRTVSGPREGEAPLERSRAMLLDLATGRAKPVGRGISEAVYSPDGGKLAVVRVKAFEHPHIGKTKEGVSKQYGQTDIYLEDLATRALSPVSVGSALDAAPRWDPSGQRLAFLRITPPLTFESALLGTGDTIYEVNADGSCPTVVLHQTGTGFTGVSFRPGAEHAAGRISC
jgi:dipeptidyl aminopeptidase/acylaminoacyl peptidase